MMANNSFTKRCFVHVDGELWSNTTYNTSSSQENQPCAILRPRLFYVLICISAQARVPGTLVHFIYMSHSYVCAISAIPIFMLFPFLCPHLLGIISSSKANFVVANGSPIQNLQILISAIMYSHYCMLHYPCLLKSNCIVKSILSMYSYRIRCDQHHNISHFNKKLNDELIPPNSLFVTTRKCCNKTCFAL